MSRYPRGKSWNWYKRHKGEFKAELWLAMRKGKHAMIYELGERILYGPRPFTKHEPEFTGLDLLL